MPQSHFTNDFASATYLEDGIIVLQFLQDNITLTSEQVIEGWQAARQLNPNLDSPVMLQTAKHTLIEPSARKVALRQMEDWKKVAIVVHGLGQKLVGKFAIKLFAKRNTIKLFDKREDALDWLKSE